MAQQPKKKAGAVLDAQLGRYATDQGLHSSASESLDVQAQLRAALAANSVRVMDLFTEWDENRDGVIDYGEFIPLATALINRSRPLDLATVTRWAIVNVISWSHAPDGRDVGFGGVASASASASS